MPLPKRPSEQLTKLKAMLIDERRMATRNILELNEANGDTVGLAGKVAEITNLHELVGIIDRIIQEEVALEGTSGARPLREGTPENAFGFDEN